MLTITLLFFFHLIVTHLVALQKCSLYKAPSLNSVSQILLALAPIPAGLGFYSLPLFLTSQVQSLSLPHHKCDFGWQKQRGVTNIKLMF